MEVPLTRDTVICAANHLTRYILSLTRDICPRIGKVQYSIALDLTLYAVDETEYVVLSRVLSEVLTAGNSIEEDEAATAKYWVSVRF